MHNRKMPSAALLLAVGLLVSCANPATHGDADTGSGLDGAMRSSFRTEAIARVERLQQDATNAACSKAQGAPLAEDVARSIEAENLKTVRMPSDGKFLGNWKEGERLAQNGRGMTWTDSTDQPKANGGNCYNCHQLDKAEVSYGTLGPSLYGYGRLHGVANPSDPGARAVLENTWTKLYNAKALNACSGMPRFGQAGILDEAQLKDLMALLLDPSSPVNQ
jgi:sulfur-oxidizing protein SoxX